MRFLLKGSGRYKLRSGLTTEACEATKINTLLLGSQLVIGAETRRNRAICCGGGFARSPSVNLHLPTFQMWPKAVGVQMRFASVGIERN